MIQENGVVVKVEGQQVWIETQRKTACDSCSVNKGCGNALLSNVLGKKRNVVQVATTESFNVGDPVLLGLEESALVKGSFAVYIMPLVLMLLFALLGEYFGSFILSHESEALTIIFAGVGFIAGVFWLKMFATKNRCNKSYHPSVQRKA